MAGVRGAESRAVGRRIGGAQGGPVDPEQRQALPPVVIGAGNRPLGSGPVNQPRAIGGAVGSRFPLRGAPPRLARGRGAGRTMPSVSERGPGRGRLRLMLWTAARTGACPQQYPRACVLYPERSRTRDRGRNRTTERETEISASMHFALDGFGSVHRDRFEDRQPARRQSDGAAVCATETCWTSKMRSRGEIGAQRAAERAGKARAI